MRTIGVRRFGLHITHEQRTVLLIMNKSGKILLILEGFKPAKNPFENSLLCFKVSMWDKG